MGYTVVGNCPTCGAPIYGYPEIGDARTISMPIKRTCTCMEWTGVSKFCEAKKDQAAEAINSVGEIVERLSPADRKRLLKMGDALFDKLRKIYNGPS